jgi:dTDP-4-dehydrorhamnose reductase
MNILLLGSSGFLGQEIYKSLKKTRGIRLYHNGLKKRHFDLTKITNLKKLIIKSKADLIINALGYTNIDLCEKKTESYLINVKIIKDIFLIKNTHNQKFRFIHFSTDQLYDSKNIKLHSENSRTIINNKYTQQKLQAEKICMSNNALIFRTNFFGKTKSSTSSFTNWIFTKFKQKKKFYLFNDIFFNPLRASTISKILIKIILKKKFYKCGIYNLGSHGYINKSNFAIEFAKKTKIYQNNYTLINARKILTVARSRNMVMNNRKFIKNFKIKLPNIYEEIKNESKKY